MKKYILLGLLSIISIVSAQQRRVQRVGIGFMNVENLWDIYPSADYIDGTLLSSNPAFHRSVPIDSLKYLPITEEYKGQWVDKKLFGKKVVRKQVLSDDFTPNSPKAWTKKRYDEKLIRISKVIADLGREYTKTAPVIAGLIEVENRQVVQDLVQQPALVKYDYGIAHFNSYDPRGIDVAIIYQKKRFVPIRIFKKEVVNFNEDGKREYTRDILVVYGVLDGEKVGVLMNHWPSRRGGASSEPKRNIAGKTLKNVMDELRSEIPNVKLIAMGDFNDDPVNESITKHLGAEGEEKKLSEDRPYFNPMWKLFKNGVASYAYRDGLNMFDQIIISKNLVNLQTEGYKMFKTDIFAPKYLITDSGQYKGYPFRAWAGDIYQDGYSDHFPAFIVLQRDIIK